MKDLSGMLNWETGLTAGESMSGGNTVSPNPNDAMGAPGSMPVNTPSVKPRLNDTPNMDMADSDSKIESAPPSTTHEVTKSDTTWKKV